MPDPVAPIPLSFYVKERQKAFLPILAEMIQAMWTNYAGEYAGYRGQYWETRGWRSNEQHFLWVVENKATNGWLYPRWVEFLWNGWEPDAQFHYEDADLDDQGESDFPGHAWLIDLRMSDTPLKISETETLTIEQDRSVEVHKGLQIDVGVEATQTIKGEYAGVGFEGSLKESLGISSSKDTTTAEGESKSKTTEKSIEYEAAAGKSTLIRFTSQRSQSRRKFSVDGAFTFGIRFLLDSVTAYPPVPGRKILANGWNDIQWVKGKLPPNGSDRIRDCYVPKPGRLRAGIRGAQRQVPRSRRDHLEEQGRGLGLDVRRAQPLDHYDRRRNPQLRRRADHRD